jgi:hypothetical protein
LKIFLESLLPEKSNRFVIVEFARVKINLKQITDSNEIDNQKRNKSIMKAMSVCGKIKWPGAESSDYKKNLFFKRVQLKLPKPPIRGDCDTNAIVINGSAATNAQKQSEFSAPLLNGDAFHIENEKTANNVSTADHGSDVHGGFDQNMVHCHTDDQVISDQNMVRCVTDDQVISDHDTYDDDDAFYDSTDNGVKDVCIVTNGRNERSSSTPLLSTQSN